MKFTIDYKPDFVGTILKVVNFTAEGCWRSVTEDVADFDGIVDPAFISSLRAAADELERHNERMKNGLNA